MKILVTRKLPGKIVDKLKELGEVVEASQKNWQAEVTGVEVIVCCLTEKITEEVLEKAGSQLKLVANYAVGFDNIDLEACKKRGILVTNTPGTQGDAVAEFSMMLVQALARMLREADNWCRAGNYEGWDPELFLGLDLTGKILGIVGAGRIGQIVGKRLHKVFEMPVIYFNRSRKEEWEKECGGAKKVNLEELCKQADVISLHVPLTAETKYLIGEKELNLMKSTTILVNTSRGPVIEEKALLKALKENKLWGVALDVFEAEPKLDTDPKDNLRLVDFKNVILTPHIASGTIEARDEMGEMIVQNIEAIIKNQRPPYLIGGEK